MHAVKSFIFPLLAFLCCIGANLSAQNPLAERKVSIHVTNTPPETVLNDIGRQAGFTFSYSPAVLNGIKPVSLNAENTPVRVLLEEIFNGQVTYKERGTHLILTRKAVKAEPSAITYLVKGYVRDGSNGKELAEVSIFDKKSRVSSVTDTYGYFELKINNKEKAQEIALHVNKAAYQDTIIYLRQSGATMVQVELIPFNSSALPFDSSAYLDSLVTVDQLKLVTALLNDHEEANTRNISDTLHHKFQLSLVPYIGTNHSLSGNTINDYSINALAGYSMGTRKAEIAGLVNIDRDSVRSVQLAGLANIDGGPVKGLQMAGIVNHNLKTLEGAQFSGVLNYNGDSVNAAQFSGVINLNRKNTHGFQAAGVMNVNLSSASSTQIAGVMNVGLKKINGVQAAGVLNVCLDTVSGVQLAGVLNIAGVVAGSQIGLLNIADTCSGAPVGLISYVHKGYHQLEISTDEVMPLHVSLRTGIRSFYNILTAGIRPDTIENQWMFGYGLGSAANLGKRWQLNFDLTMNQAVLSNRINEFNPLTRFNLAFEKRFSKYFSVAAGPTLNLLYANTQDPDYNQLLKDLPDGWILSEQRTGEYQQTLWIGAKAAVRFF